MRRLRSSPVNFTIAGLLWVFCLAVAPCSMPAWGQQAPAVTGPDKEELATILGPQDAAELEAFLDGLMAANLDAHHIAGATAAVIKDGGLFFAKGYGFADLEEQTPVRPDRTLFRIASISKLFVWTAVMQLAEQGRLDLNADINQYLTHFKIPETFEQPITLAHLMTHTAGFEEYVIGLFARDASRQDPLGEILAREIPARVRPPGEVAAYSNHGTGIAAYIVEQVSGRNWNEYVEDNILIPLEMTRTTFRQPLPERLADDLATGYLYSGGEFQPQGFEYVPLAPVGGASTTATDMARFMQAHLHLGRLGDVEILAEETARQMHHELFRHAPEVNAMAHGFMDLSRNGQYVIGHGGATLWFHSLLILLPDHNTGLFVSFNSQNGRRAAMTVFEAFMDRYYPAGRVPAVTPPAEAAGQLERFAGLYRSTRRVHERFTKLGAMMNLLEVRPAPDGTLKTIGDEVTRWVPVSPLTFRERNGLRILAFRADPGGWIRYMFMGDRPYYAYERVPVTESPPLQTIPAIIALAVFVLTLVFWPTAAIIRHGHRIMLNPETRIPRAAYAVAWLAGLMFVLFAVGLMTSLGNSTAIVFGLPAGLSFWMTFPLVGLVFGVVTLLYTLMIWIKGRGGFWRRIWFTLVMLSCAAAVWVLYTWNLLGYRY
ncbi:MAG: beta-lactamase family protein [Acidobacteria bacterium]|nr:beta-lactamase family protein [Acidobacteriota bacterium]